MPSFITDENHIVTTVMSFDPAVPEAIELAEYDTSIVGKQYINGQFTEPEPENNE